MRQKKGTNFLLAHFFQYLKETVNFFSHTLNLRKLKSISYNSVYLILACVENFCSDSDIKHFMFTSQVIKLMITG